MSFYGTMHIETKKGKLTFMKVIHDKKHVVGNQSFGIGLGNFDGIHLAHKELINTLVDECIKRDLPSMIYTFTEHPVNVLSSNKIKIISTMEKKTAILEGMNVDFLTLCQFNQTFADMEAVDFVKDILVKRYHVKLVIIGFNYHFGYKGLGDVNLLKNMGKEYGFEVISLDPIYFQGEIISSSNIREKIKNGDMIGTKKLLGKYYSMNGRVEYGNRIGTVMGFPTANIIPLRDYALPKYGVYYTNTIVDGKRYESITNLGFNPTIAEGKKVIIETHIFDFSGWLYGKEIEVIFKQFIRNEQKFDNFEQLKEQVLLDISVVKKIYGGN